MQHLSRFTFKSTEHLINFEIIKRKIEGNSLLNFLNLKVFLSDQTF